MAAPGDLEVLGAHRFSSSWGYTVCVAALLCAGCEGNVTCGDCAPAPTATPTPDPRMPGGDPTTPLPSDCSKPAPGAAPVRRMTRAEYNEACARQFIDSFGKRAFRRPLTRDESAMFFGQFSAGLAAGDFATGIQLVIERCSLRRLAGSAGGYFKTGQHLSFDGKNPHNDLLVSLLNSMGVDTNTFGMPEYCRGALAGLAV